MHGAPAAPRSIAETGWRASDLLNLDAQDDVYEQRRNADADRRHSETPRARHSADRRAGAGAQAARRAGVCRNPRHVGVALLADRKRASSAPSRRWGKTSISGPRRFRSKLSANASSASASPTNASIAHRSTRHSPNLVISEKFVRDIGPAINSGQLDPALRSAGQRQDQRGRAHRNHLPDMIYIPYCFEVEGQIIKVFDPGVHEPVAQCQRGRGNRTGICAARISTGAGCRASGPSSSPAAS